MKGVAEVMIYCINVKSKEKKRSKCKDKFIASDGGICNHEDFCAVTFCASIFYTRLCGSVLGAWEIVYF